MLRRLFACLALLTGLAAAGAPAHAHVAEAEIAQIEAALHEAAGESAAIALVPRSEATGWCCALSDSFRALAGTVVLPSVHLRIDRARE